MELFVESVVTPPLFQVEWAGASSLWLLLFICLYGNTRFCHVRFVPVAGDLSHVILLSLQSINCLIL